MQKKTSILNRTRVHIISVLSSKYFFYFIVALIISQGLWYALSFQPTLFDETKHLARVQIFSEQWNPFLGEQKPAWDHAGAVVRDGSCVYYYFMSMPLRLVRIFTQEPMAQIIFLRLINLAFFVMAVAVYRKALVSTKRVPIYIIHLSLLFTLLVPGFSLLPGAVNYDNLSMLFFSVMLFLGIRLLNSEKFLPVEFLTLLILSLSLTIVKWTGVALAAPLVLFILYDVFKQHGKHTLTRTAESFKKMPRMLLVTMVAIIVILCGLFIERPVLNVIRYADPDPSCDKVLAADRCLKFNDYAIYEIVDSKKPKNFKPLDPAQYFIVLMAPRMINAHTSVLPIAASVGSSSLPIMQSTFFILIPIGFILLLLYLRDHLKYKVNRFLLFVSGAYLAIVFTELYKAYVDHAIPAALHSRYLIPIYPILLCFVGISLRKLLKELRLEYLGIVFLVVVMLLFTQGGGLINQSVVAQERLYWDNKKVRELNSDLNSFLKKVVKEGKYTDSLPGY